MYQALESLLDRSLMSALAAFGLTLGVIMLLTPLARRFGWVDRPGGRKTHGTPTPVIGGIAMLIGSVPLAVTTFDITPQVLGLMAAGALVIATGIWDDLHDLRWYWRLVAQAAAALCLVYIGGVRVEMIGPLFGGHAESLGFLSVPFTVIATIGLMNALNMVDGIDGLAGSVTAAALIMLAAAAVYSGNVRLSHGLVLLLGALVAFLAFNLRTPGRRTASIFLGNAGSEFLGLVIAWCSFRLTQNAAHPVTPALAPFLLGPPVIDCLVVMVRRVRNKRSPFSADRNHFHHILLDAGWPTSGAVALIVAISIAMGLAAALALKAQVKPIWLVLAFSGLTIGYYIVSAKRARCIAFFRRLAIALGAVRIPAEAAFSRRSPAIAGEGASAAAVAEDEVSSAGRPRL